MPTEPVLRAALELVEEGPHDQTLIAVLLKKFQQPDCLSLMGHRSRRLTEDLLNVCRVLELVPRMRDWLELTPLVWIPRQRFYLAAVRVDDTRFIAVSHGFQDVLNATAEFLTMKMVLSEAAAIDAAAWGDKDLEYSKVFMRVLHSQVEGSEAIFLPHVVDEMPHRLRGATHLLAYTARIFGVLHEIGHFELGHLDPHAPADATRPTVLREDAPIQEQDNQEMEQEYDADSFAARQMRTDLEGAETFFTILSIIHATRGYRGVTHPHFANRIANLRREHSSRAPSGTSYFEHVMQLESLAAGYDYQFANHEAFAEIRRRLPHMPEAGLPGMWINEFQTRLLAEVKRRPELYPAWI